MKPQDLRRQYNAARTLERAETLRVRLDTRTTVATTVLAMALGENAETRVPGYRVTRTPDGIAVHPLPAYDAAQLALWREMTQGAER